MELTPAQQQLSKLFQTQTESDNSARPVASTADNEEVKQMINVLLGVKPDNQNN
jgi:hypothetical protein